MRTHSLILATVLAWPGLPAALAVPAASSTPSSAAPPATAAPLSIGAVARAKLPAVVEITGSGPDGASLASGFLVSPAGRLLTNFHVVADSASLTVKLADGRTFKDVSVIKADEDNDLIVLQIDAAGLPFIQPGDSDKVEIGDPIIAIGNPLGLENTVSAGLISQVRKGDDGDKLFQISAPISPGNSGGPLLDAAGDAIGVVEATIRAGQNLNFAIPINTARPLLASTQKPALFVEWIKQPTYQDADWTSVDRGTWVRQAGKLEAQTHGTGRYEQMLLLDRHVRRAANFDLVGEVKLQSRRKSALEGKGDLLSGGLAFRASPDGRNYYGFYLYKDPHQDQWIARFAKFLDGEWKPIADARVQSLNADGWNELKVHCEGDQLQGYVNGQPVSTVQDSSIRFGRVGLVKFYLSPAQFKDFQYTPLPGGALPIAASAPVVPPTATAAELLQALHGLEPDLRAEPDGTYRVPLLPGRGPGSTVSVRLEEDRNLANVYSWAAGTHLPTAALSHVLERAAAYPFVRFVLQAGPGARPAGLYAEANLPLAGLSAIMVDKAVRQVGEAAREQGTEIAHLAAPSSARRGRR